MSSEERPPQPDECPICTEKYEGYFEDHLKKVHRVRYEDFIKRELKRLDDEAELALRYEMKQREMRARKAACELLPGDLNRLWSYWETAFRYGEYTEAEEIMNEMYLHITINGFEGRGLGGEIDFTDEEFRRARWRTKRVNTRWSETFRKNKKHPLSSVIQNLFQVHRLSLYHAEAFEDPEMENYVKKQIEKLIEAGEEGAPLAVEALFSVMDYRYLMPHVLHRQGGNTALQGLLEGLCMEEEIADECAFFLRERAEEIGEKLLGIVKDNKDDQEFLFTVLGRLSAYIPQNRFTPVVEELLEGGPKEAELAARLVIRLKMEDMTDRVRKAAEERGLYELKELLSTHPI